MLKQLDINENELIEKYYAGYTNLEIADYFGCSKTTIKRRLTAMRKEGRVEHRVDDDILNENLKLIASKQKYMDKDRINRTKIRQDVRLLNAVKELNKELINILKKHELPKNSIKKVAKNMSQHAGAIVQLSDLHFNELVDVANNKYDFNVAAKRLKLFVAKTKLLLKSQGIKKILIALTGDMLNSDRRLDEVLNQATNRASAVFLSVCILEQVILDLAQDFEVSVTSVVGNESRIGKEFEWSEITASDNFDLIIHNILKLIFKKTRVKFPKFESSVEQVVTVSGQNVLLMHGNSIKSTSIEKQIQQIKGKYIDIGIKLDYIIFGHQHSARLGDTGSRSSSLVGSNAYSFNALSLSSKASQNVYIFYTNGNIDSYKLCLQNIAGITGYKIKNELEAYNAKSINKAKKKVTIVKIVI